MRLPSSLLLAALASVFPAAGATISLDSQNLSLETWSMSASATGSIPGFRSFGIPGQLTGVRLSSFFYINISADLVNATDQELPMPGCGAFGTARIGGSATVGGAFASGFGQIPHDVPPGEPVSCYSFEGWPPGGLEDPVDYTPISIFDSNSVLYEIFAEAFPFGPDWTVTGTWMTASSVLQIEYDYEPYTVPEPAPAALLALGTALMLALKRRL